MKKSISIIIFKPIITSYLLIFSVVSFSQSTSKSLKPESDFWKKVQFGGGVGLGIGSGYTDISIAPSAIYNINPYFSAGVGLQGSYISVKNNYNSFIYGGSIIGLLNPVEQIQLSIELEQLRVNTTSNVALVGANIFPKNNFWNTALYLGAGYRTDNITVGVRYNILFNKSDQVYSEAFMPFVRIYF